MDRRRMPLTFKACIMEMGVNILVDFRLSKVSDTRLAVSWHLSSDLFVMFYVVIYFSYFCWSTYWRLMLELLMYMYYNIEIFYVIRQQF